MLIKTILRLYYFSRFKIKREEQLQSFDALWHLSTHFVPVLPFFHCFLISCSHFYNPWKRQKSFLFLFLFFVDGAIILWKVNEVDKSVAPNIFGDDDMINKENWTVFKMLRYNWPLQHSKASINTSSPGLCKVFI